MGKKRHKLTPSSYLILIKDNKILLSRRHNTGFEDGNYGLVSGHLDGGETFREAIIREAKEEAGIDLNIKELEVVHVSHRFAIFSDVGKRERVDVFIKANNWEGEPNIMEPEKCDDIGWFSLNDLPKNTIDYIREAVKNINKNVFYGEFGFNSDKNLDL